MVHYGVPFVFCMFIITTLQKGPWLCFDNISSLTLPHCPLVVLHGRKDHLELRLQYQPSLSPAGQPLLVHSVVSYSDMSACRLAIVLLAACCTCKAPQWQPNVACSILISFASFYAQQMDHPHDSKVGT